MSDVLVLNADLGPLHRVSPRHAVRMLVRRVAGVHEARPDAEVIAGVPLRTAPTVRTRASVPPR